MKQINVGVMTHGPGAHLDEYFVALAETPEVAAVAIHDEGARNIARARSKLGAKLAGVFESPEQMLAEFRPPLALVSMQPNLSPPAIARALEAGCHVLTEKPACIRPEDFAKLVDKAHSKHLHLMLALANRPHAPVQRARKLVRQGKLGKLFGVNMHLVADQERLTRPDYRDSWRCRKAEAGGGHLLWLGIHWLDMYQFITGTTVEQVAGFAGVVGGQPIDVEDSAAVSLKFSDGTFGTMLSGFYLDKFHKYNVKKYHSHMQIWGEEGWLRLSTFEEEPLEWYSSKGPGKPRVEQWEYTKGVRSYTPFVREAVRASAGLQDAPVTPDECLHVLRTIFAFYRAAETGTAVKVEAIANRE